MQIQLKLISAFNLMMICTSLYAQENFKAEDLAFLEKTAFNLKSNSVKSFMKEKGFTFVEKGEAFEITSYLFEDSKKTTTVVVGFTPSDKLYGVMITSPLTPKNAMTGFELEQFYGFEIADENDTYTEWKKKNYPFHFLVMKGTEEGRTIKLTTNDSFNKPTKHDRLVTVDRLKEVLGLNNKSLQQILRKKKYFHDKSLDSEENGRSEEVYTDVDFETDIVINYKNGKSFIITVDNITEDEYNNVLQWLKSNKNEKMEPEIGMFDTRDSWDIFNGDYTVFLTYHHEPNFKPEKIHLRKNH